MRDIIIIGGGLTGLAAAWELEQLGADYTLIELKRRLGGSIRTVREHRYIIDAGSSLYEKVGDWTFLDELGLHDALDVVGESPNGSLVLVRKGTQTLTDTLAARITHPIMLRMAVSSLGTLSSGGYSVCLENGLLLDAKALIIAAPARYAEHMLRTLQPDAAYRLLDYRYDSVARVTLGYPRSHIDESSAPPEDYGITAWHWITHPARVPAGYTLLQAGVRLRVEDDVPQDLPLQLAAAMRWPLNPTVARVDYWPTADPLTCYAPDHMANMAAIERLLPGRVALVGSDYRAFRLDQRVEQGREAARQVVAALDA